MEALMYFLLALVCAVAAFSSNDEKPKKGKKSNNNNDDITKAVAAFGMMDYMSDGKLDGNFTNED